MLIANGHDAWSYSPRQAAAFAEFVQKRRDQETLRDYSVIQAAFHNDKEADKAFRKKLDGSV